MNTAMLPPSVQRARTLLRPRSNASGGLFDVSRVKGRVVEVSESGYFGALSALTGLMAQFQTLGEQIGWVDTGSSLFFPPDLGFRGIDVGAVSVVLAPDPKGGLLAADWLLRSGAFGLVVVDWTGKQVDDSDLGRLARLAEDRQTSLLFMTRKQDEDPSLSSQVSMRGIVGRTAGGETEWSVTRDKRSGPPALERMRFHGPFGLY